MREDQSEIERKGEEILNRMEAHSKVSLFSKDFWYGSILDWSMKNEQFKTNMFRFVDVLPSLNKAQEVTRHLKEYFSENGEDLPPVLNMGLGIGSLIPGVTSSAIKKNITQMAKMFITGETPQEAIEIFKKSRKNRITFTVDILGEATLSEKEAIEYHQKYSDLIKILSEETASWEEIPIIDSDHQGKLPKVNVSVKISALYSQINEKAWETTQKILKERLRPLFRTAIQHQATLNLDMEHYAIKDLTLEVFKNLLMEPEFISYPFFGCVIQAYLRDSEKDIHDLIELSKARKTPFFVRLVKGAYWDSETIDAEQKNWPIPVYTDKAESDAQFEKISRILLDQYQSIKPALASHNVRSLSAAIVYAEKKKVPQNAFEIQMLYGMGDPIKKTLVEMGFRVREYTPIGDLIPGMAYLVRRLLENTSNESWLRGKFADGKSIHQLLKDPNHNLQPTKAELEKKEGFFYNEPNLDFGFQKNRTQLIESLNQLRKKIPINVPIIIEAKPFFSSQIIERRNPSKETEIISKIHLGNSELAEKAIQSSLNAQEKWKSLNYSQRALMVEKMASILQRDRFKLISTQILEVGKPWSEADADVAEAIDFCKYYAREARLMDQSIRVGKVSGETSYYLYKPRGVTVVVAPWNFPLAILLGMTMAAVVTGNSVIMKPAEQSSLVALGLMEVIEEAGFPAGVINFLPGLGEEIGAFLVKHSRINTIAFTGSRAVGLEILKSASEIKDHQTHIKRCILEMGGKNAIIVDNDADLDEAVEGVLYSAFGFSGQKCSAASRIIVLDEIYNRFVDRLIEAAKSIKILSAENPDSYMGPVIDEESRDRILNQIKTYEKSHKLLFKSDIPTNGYFVPATIFGDVEPNSQLAQEEIFGPVLAIIRAQDMTEAITFTNDSKYALTAGIYSRSPNTISRVRQEVQAGNLYINRGITGAMVNRHPFGGYKMSGIGSKSGGPDYLKQFTEPICITENTLRRGFAPSE